jgi:hypothetical protein
MPARETEGIGAEAPDGCLRLGSPPGRSNYLHAMLLLSVSSWLQRDRRRQPAVTRLRRRGGDDPGSDVRPDRLTLLQARLRARHRPIVRAA